MTATLATTVSCRRAARPAAGANRRAAWTTRATLTASSGQVHGAAALSSAGAWRSASPVDGRAVIEVHGSQATSRVSPAAPTSPRAVAASAQARGASHTSAARPATVPASRSPSSVARPGTSGALASTTSGASAIAANTARAGAGTRRGRVATAAYAEATSRGHPRRSVHQAPQALVSSARRRPNVASSAQENAANPRSTWANDGRRLSRRRASTSRTGTASAVPTSGRRAVQAPPAAATSAPRAATTCGAPRLRTGVRRAQSATPAPSAKRVPPSSSAIARQPISSREARPAARAPKRSRASIPATTVQHDSAAARRPRRVTTAAAAAKSVVTPTSDRVRPVRPREPQAIATKTTPATSRHRAPSDSSTTGTESAGRRRAEGRRATGGAGGYGAAGSWAPGPEAVTRSVEVARISSTSRSAPSICCHNCSPGGPASRRPHPVQVLAGSRGARQSGQAVASASRLMEPSSVDEGQCRVGRDAQLP